MRPTPLLFVRRFLGAVEASSAPEKRLDSIGSLKKPGIPVWNTGLSLSKESVEIETGGISPCGASYFARDGKVTKTPPGGGSRATSLRYPASPRTPVFIRGRHTTVQRVIFGAGRRMKQLNTPPAAAPLCEIDFDYY